MPNPRHQAQQAELRREAERRVGRLIERSVSPPSQAPENAIALLHELQVHQIELEMQCHELQKTQTELEDSRDTYRELYESIPVGYVTVDRDGRLYDINTTALTLLKSEIPLRPIQVFNVFVSDEEVERFVLFCRRVASTQTADTAELNLKRSDASVFPAAIQAVPVKGGNEKDQRLRLTFTDITPQKKAEEALHRQHLELKANRADLQALTRLLFTVQEDERKRIARELHDDYCQRVTALILEANMLKNACQRNAPSLVQSVTAMSQKLSGILNDFRTLSHGLLPRSLGNVPLDVSIRHLLNEFVDKAGFEITFLEKAVAKNLQSDTLTTMYRLLQESLCNIVKHANAKHVTVTLAGTGQGGVELIVVDDGVGFDPARTWDGQKGMGIIGMRERLRLVGGTLKIMSQPGQGTTVICSIPEPEMY